MYCRASVWSATWGGNGGAQAVWWAVRWCGGRPGQRQCERLKCTFRRGHLGTRRERLDSSCWLHAALISPYLHGLGHGGSAAGRGGSTASHALRAQRVGGGMAAALHGGGLACGQGRGWRRGQHRSAAPLGVVRDRNPGLARRAEASSALAAPCKVQSWLPPSCPSAPARQEAVCAVACIPLYAAASRWRLRVSQAGL